MAKPDRTGGTVQVAGARQLRRALKQAGDDFQDLKDLNRKAAEVVAARARALAPVGPTGRLRDSVRAAGTKTAAIVRMGKKSVPYANAVHWGRSWWPNKHHPRAAISKIEGNPFVSLAAQATEAQWVGLYEDGINKIIDRIEGTTP